MQRAFSLKPVRTRCCLEDVNTGTKWIQFLLWVRTCLRPQDSVGNFICICHFMRVEINAKKRKNPNHLNFICQPENWTGTECERSKATDRKWKCTCVVYNFQCDLCDAGYVGYTRGHLHNRVKGHKQQSSAIAKHYKNVHGTIPQDPLKRFEVLKKRRNKFDCLVYEMLFIRTLKLNVNVQSDSVRAKVFS